ncbi:MAG: flippase [Sandaracinobacter sp.]
MGVGTFARQIFASGGLLGSSMRRTVALNAGWLLSDKLLRLGLGVWINAWVARTLGPEQFGLLSYAIAAVAVFSAVSTLGFGELLIREFVRYPDRREIILSSALLLRLLAGVLTLLLTCAFILVWEKGDQQLFGIVMIIASGPIAQAIDVVDLYFQAENKVMGIVLLRNVSFLAVCTARVIAIQADAPVEIFAAITTVELILVGLLIWARAKWAGIGLALSNVRKAESIRLVREAWPLMLRLLAIGIYMRVDQLMIGRMLGSGDVGVYSAAVRISEVWYLVLVAASQAATPRLAALHAGDQELYRLRLIQVMRALAILSVLVAVCMSLAAPHLIAFLYGPGFAAASDVLIIHVWAGLPVALGLVAGTWLVNSGLVRFGLYQAIAGAIVSVGANLILLPIMGIAGAAIAALLSYMVSAVFCNALSGLTRPIFSIQLKSMGLMR